MDDIQLNDPIPPCSWREWVALAIRRRRLCRVNGDSMRPALAHGDRVLYQPTRGCRVGDVVLAAHPFVAGQTIIKRVEAFDDEGRVLLRGDDPLASSDSRGFGSVSPDAILGRVTCRL